MKIETTNIYRESNSPTGDDSGGLAISGIELTFNEDALESIMKNMTIMFFYYFKEVLKQDLPSYLTYSNFLGEADNYITLNRLTIPHGEEKKARIQYAKAIFKEFMANIDSVIEYDETDNTGIILSPYVADLEFGSFYRPALGVITKAFTAFLNGVQQMVDNGYEPPAGSSDAKEKEDSEEENS